MASPAAEGSDGGDGEGGGSRSWSGGSCTRLYQQFSEEFSLLERGLAACFDAVRHKHRAVEARTTRALDSLRRRELSINDSVSLALGQLDSLFATGGGEDGGQGSGLADDAVGLAESLRALCARMDSVAFFGFVAARWKEADALCAEMPAALRCCVDPAKFVMDAIDDVFPVDRRETKNSAELACSQQHAYRTLSLALPHETTVPEASASCFVPARLQLLPFLEDEDPCAGEGPRDGNDPTRNAGWKSCDSGPDAGDGEGRGSGSCPQLPRDDEADDGACDAEEMSNIRP